MSDPIAPFQVNRFRAVIEHRLGLNFGDDKDDFLAEVLQARLEKRHETDDVYLTGLEANPSQSELSALGQVLTVPETYFFRHFDQFEALAEVALPDRIQARGASGRVSILSAGCASGEEAYSLAVIGREAMQNMTGDLSVIGIDINPEVIKKATEARYTARSLRQTTGDMQHKLFGNLAQDYVLDESIRQLVRFEQRNLVEDDPAFWNYGAFDIIFCRNVIMYFTAEQARVLIDRFARALVPGGYLFLGHAENLRGLSQDFHVCHTHNTFYYRRHTGNETVLPSQLSQGTRIRMPAPLVGLVEGNVSWVDAIRDSTERVQSLSAGPIRPGNATPPDKPQWSLGPAFDLMRRERFDEALDVVRSLPAEAANDADVALLHAVLCAHRGQLDEAHNLCQHLLQLDELNAGAHYVLAMCYEGAGDNSAAVSHDQTAVYLDPAFAMPRLHLGLLARRSGDIEMARRELQQALALLEREELSRLLLFGGGFGREALLALCRAELTACGG